MKQIILLSLFIGNFAFAQIPNMEARVRHLEQKTYQLEQQNTDLQRRVWNLEQYVYNHPSPQPPPPVYGQYVCATEHTANFRVYVGKNKSKVQAQALANNQCSGQNTNPQFCVENGCSAEDTQTHTCRITHTVNKQDFVGQAKSVTEAGAIARNSCAGQNLYPQHCDIQTLICD